MLPKWQSFIGMCSQIWQYSKYETKKISSTLSCCMQLWQFLVIFFPHVLTIFFKKKEEFTTKYSYLNMNFKMAKIRHQKNHNCIECVEGLLTLRGFYKIQKNEGQWSMQNPRLKNKYKTTSHYNLQVVKNKMPKRGKRFSISTLKGVRTVSFWLGEKRKINGVKLKTNCSN
jgi:hypothetical protein